MTTGELEMRGHEQHELRASGFHGMRKGLCCKVMDKVPQGPPHVGLFVAGSYPWHQHPGCSLDTRSYSWHPDFGGFGINLADRGALLVESGGGL